jgi:hypothetical protein
VVVVGIVVVVGVLAGVVVAGTVGAGAPPGAAGAGGWGGADQAAAPGCSRARVTPMNPATPMARSTAARVRRQMRICVRARTAGETGE